eukprot:scaffold13221_cov100-Isochrysis_galbana.AAC.4
MAESSASKGGFPDGGVTDSGIAARSTRAAGLDTGPLLARAESGVTVRASTAAAAAAGREEECISASRSVVETTCGELSAGDARGEAPVEAVGRGGGGTACG